jgi:hypothetical protein
MLSLQQQLLLKAAVNTTDILTKERTEAVDRAIQMVQMMTPNQFHPNVPYHAPTKEMRERVFFDEPVDLPLANYGRYVVSYTEENQTKKFKRRDAVYYAGGKKQ